MKTVAIIGAGRLGTSLAAALAGKGCQVKAVSDCDAAAAREGLRIIGQGRAFTDNTLAAAAAEVVFLCLSDDVLAGEVKKLSRSGIDWKGKFVFHTSGLHSSGVLGPLKKLGALAASLHPIQAFAGKKTPASHFEGIFWGVEGNLQAVSLGREIAANLGGRILRIRAGQKPLYHAACVMASNFLVMLLDQAAALLEEAGVSRQKAARALFPLVEGTLRNVKGLDVSRALTGPLVRGDLRSVKAHLDALRRRPETRQAYQALGKTALGAAAKQGLSPQRLTALKRLLEGK
jgi:predicted short-subunit dehydrogenase-like oxidoreductase (DUF2520 family)